MTSVKCPECQSDGISNKREKAAAANCEFQTVAKCISTSAIGHVHEWNDEIFTVLLADKRKPQLWERTCDNHAGKADPVWLDS